MIFDTHAHYDDEAFNEDRDQILSSMKDGGVGCIVNVCASVGGFGGTLELMKAYPFVYGAVGGHPDDAGIMTQDTLDEIRRLSHMEKMVAIGEIGLDYYWHKEEAEHKQQQEMFRAQMDIAREEKLPFMIHSRDAAEDTLEIVKEYMKKDMFGGIIHCFSYSKEIAAEYFQKCKEAERSSCHSAAVPDRSGNGLPLHGTGAQSRQEKFLLESALCCRSPGADQGNYCRRSNCSDGRECEAVIIQSVNFDGQGDK